MKPITDFSADFIMENPAKAISAFNRFWEDCKSKIAKNDLERTQLNEKLVDGRNRISHFKTEVIQTRDFLRAMPIIVAIGIWMEGLMNDSFWFNKYVISMEKLIALNLIPSTNDDGSVATLDFFMTNGHQEILETIRCTSEWSLFQKEEIVQCYVAFSQSLSRQTYGLIPPGFDTDRERVRFKAVKYEVFLDFVLCLSERDALMAKLLYFGAPSLEEVLSLKKDAIDVTSYSIRFREKVINFPRHLILDLYAHAKSQDEELVFTNFKKAEIERTHLHQSFSRACERMTAPTKITPGLLLRLESENSERSEI